MLHRRRILGLSLFLIASLPFAVSSAAAGDTCDSGKAHGKWVLPRKNHHGRMLGGLFTQHDKPLYVVSATLLRTHHSDHARSGVLLGHVRLAGDSDSKPFLVFGHWAASSDGSGKFKARVFESKDALRDHDTLGWISGSFKDPQDGQAGVFHGQWKICP